jgi:hypothetical protein
MAEAGLEPPADYPGKARVSTENDAKSDALSADSSVVTDLTLVSLIAEWPKLHGKEKIKILQLFGHLKATRKLGDGTESPSGKNEVVSRPWINEM